MMTSRTASTNSPKTAPCKALLSGLYVQAVLGSLPDLAAVCEEAHGKIANWNCAMAIGVFGGPRTLLEFEKGTISVVETTRKPVLHLGFASHSQAIRMLGQDRFAFPLIWGCPTLMPKLAGFARLGKILRSHLEPQKEQLQDKTFASAHVRLSLRVALLSLPVLAHHDATVRDWLAQGPRGMSQLESPNDRFCGWVDWTLPEPKAGFGPAPRPAEVVIRIEDTATALESLAGTLDGPAAVGLGTVQVHGLVPLADILNLAMERTSTYLRPS